MPDDPKIAEALVHDANVVLRSDDPDSVGREGDLDAVKEKLRLAEKLLAGNGDDETREAAREAMHPQTASLFKI